MIKKAVLLVFLSTFFAGQVLAQWSKEERERIGRLSREDHQLMMKRLGITRLRPGPSGNPKAPNAANTDESKATPYTSLPDPLVFGNGTAVKTADQWEKRRLEIFEAFVTFPALFLYPNRQSVLITLYRLNPSFLQLGFVVIFTLAGILSFCIFKHYRVKGLLLSFILLLLILVPVIPVIVFSGGISSRTIYLATAMVCVSLAVWVLAKPRATTGQLRRLKWQLPALCLTFQLTEPRACSLL